MNCLSVTELADQKLEHNFARYLVPRFPKMVTREPFEVFEAVATSEANGLEKICFQPPGFDGGIQFQWVVGLRCQFSTGKEPEATSDSLASVLSTRLLESSGQQEEASVLKPRLRDMVVHMWPHVHALFVLFFIWLEVLHSFCSHPRGHHRRMGQAGGLSHKKPCCSSCPHSPRVKCPAVGSRGAANILRFKMHSTHISLWKTEKANAPSLLSSIHKSKPNQFRSG